MTLGTNTHAAPPGPRLRVGKATGPPAQDGIPKRRGQPLRPHCAPRARLGVTVPMPWLPSSPVASSLKPRSPARDETAPTLPRPSAPGRGVRHQARVPSSSRENTCPGQPPPARAQQRCPRPCSGEAHWRLRHRVRPGERGRASSLPTRSLWGYFWKTSLTFG